MDLELQLAQAFARNDALAAELRRERADHQAAYDALAHDAERDLADANRLLTAARLDAEQARQDAAEAWTAFEGQRRLAHKLQALLEAMQKVNEAKDSRVLGGFESPARPHPIRGALSLPVWKAPTR